jgi:hypothetical protein
MEDDTPAGVIAFFPEPHQHEPMPVLVGEPLRIHGFDPEEIP